MISSCEILDVCAQRFAHGGTSGSLVIRITWCVRDNAENGFLCLWFFRESEGPNNFHFLRLTVNKIFSWKLVLAIFKITLDFKNCPFTLSINPRKRGEDSKDLDLNKLLAYQSGLLKNIELSQNSRNITSLIPVTKSSCGPTCRNHVSIGTYLYPFFLLR